MLMRLKRGGEIEKNKNKRNKSTKNKNIVAPEVTKGTDSSM